MACSVATADVAEAEELALDEVDDVDLLASLVWAAELSPLDDPFDDHCPGGGPGGGGGGAFCAMDSRPVANSEDDSSPSPLVSNDEKALAMALAEDEVELELTPRALSMSDRLIEPSLLVPIWLTRSLARVLAAASRVDDPLVVEALEDELDDDDDPAWAEVKADKVSELKRYEPELEGGGP